MFSTTPAVFFLFFLLEYVGRTAMVNIEMTFRDIVIIVYFLVHFKI